MDHCKNAGNLTHEKLLEKCDVHFVYLGKLTFIELLERSLLFENSNMDNINSVLAALKYDPNRKCVIKHDIGHTLVATRKPTYRPSSSPEYDTEDNLNDKINIVNIGKFNCGTCELKAIMKKELNSHCAQSHQGISCNDCRKKFRYHSSLIQHKYIHWKQIYKYLQYERGFYFLSQMRVHCNIHLKCHKYKWFYKLQEKIYLAIWYILTQKIHSDKSYKCAMCGFRRKEKCQVMEYTKSHDRNRYSCKNCDQSFKYQQQKIRHGTRLIDSTYYLVYISTGIDRYLCF